MFATSILIKQLQKLNDEAQKTMEQSQICAQNNIVNSTCSESENVERSQHICAVAPACDSSLKAEYLGLKGETDLKNLVEDDCGSLTLLENLDTFDSNNLLANQPSIINGGIFVTKQQGPMQQTQPV
jgi:hypothetical protein